MRHIALLVSTILLSAALGAALWVVDTLLEGPHTSISGREALAGLVLLVIGLPALILVSRRLRAGLGATIPAAVLLPVLFIAAFAVVSVRYTAPVPRYEAGVALLSDGTVLVAGGDRGLNFPDMAPTVTADAFLYTPAHRQWTLTSPMPAPRERFVMVRLRDGRVLLAGGSAQPYSGTGVASAYLYHPTSRTWTVTGSMTLPREFRDDPVSRDLAAAAIPFRAVLLGTGDVLVMGGRAPRARDATSVELYNPRTGRWRRTASIACGDGFALTVTALTALPNGNALALCADYAGTVWPEVYDARGGHWTVRRSHPLVAYGSGATLLPDGRLLLAGGSADTYGNEPVTSVDLYDVRRDRWTVARDLPSARIGLICGTLTSRDALCTGGYATDRIGPRVVSTSYSSAGMIYHARENRWVTTAPAHGTGVNAPLLLLPNGSVLAAQGFDAPQQFDAGSGAWASLPDAALKNLP